MQLSRLEILTKELETIENIKFIVRKNEIERLRAILGEVLDKIFHVLTDDFELILDENYLTHWFEHLTKKELELNKKYHLDTYEKWKNYILKHDVKFKVISCIDNKSVSYNGFFINIEQSCENVYEIILKNIHKCPCYFGEKSSAIGRVLGQGFSPISFD